MSCLGMPLRSAWVFSMPPNKTAHARLASQIMAEECRALGATASVNVVHFPVAGFHSQVSPNATETPDPW